MNAKETLFGAVAQLGERLPCTQEVIGSIPFGSTTFFVISFFAIFMSELGVPALGAGPTPLNRSL